MQIGFETVGNATVICYDGGKPVLATDPWLRGDAYFGSWICSHEIPEEQIAAVQAAEWIWLSHGHPDHLSSSSLELLQGKTFLLPDHEGERIHSDLTALGFTVKVIPSRTWVPISEHVRILCVPDYNQDAALLIDVNGRLLVNLNDSSARGSEDFVRRIVRKYAKSFLLKLSGTGDANMVNLFTEDGDRIPFGPGLQEPVGKKIAREMRNWGVKFYIPFSSMHRYQRTDSAWLNSYIADLEDYSVGFESAAGTLLPAFIAYDCETDAWKKLVVADTRSEILPPETFGDDWNQPLTPEDKQKLDEYFLRIEHLQNVFDFVRFEVGREEHVVPLSRQRFNRGLTFNTPRQSLMTAIEYQVFDDLMIGNFTKTTIHGNSRHYFYADFIPYVGKYADNGQARSQEELDNYFRAYRQRAPYDYLKHRLEAVAVNRLRPMLGDSGPLVTQARRAYHFLKKTRSRLPV